MTEYLYPYLTRAGLGNELFPYLRALEAAESNGAELVYPRWSRFRPGPLLRGERDRRQYGLLFTPPRLRERLLRQGIEASLFLGRVLRRASSVTVFAGMEGYYEPFSHPGPWFRDRLREVARPGVIGEPPSGPYVSVHLRLGDFTPPTAGERVTENNESTPIGWFAARFGEIQTALPGIPIILSSDGTDAQLEQLLRLPGVTRSSARNALDEMVLLSHSIGMLGSRSTFTSWGAFLGDVPLLVMTGGNAYRPHQQVWESGIDSGSNEWLQSVVARLETTQR